MRNVTGFTMEEGQPIGRIAWCPQSTWYIAAIPIEDRRIAMYDIRSTSSPCNYVAGHKFYVNNLQWSQFHASQVVSSDYGGNVREGEMGDV